MVLRAPEPSRAWRFLLGVSGAVEATNATLHLRQAGLGQAHVRLHPTATDPMSDMYQIDIPSSFIALHADVRGRLLLPLSNFRERYELCEDLAQHLAEHCRTLQVEIGVEALDLLQRCERGLLASDSVVSESEAQWVMRRLAELLGLNARC